MTDFLEITNGSILAISTTVGKSTPSVGRYRVTDITRVEALAKISIEEIGAPLLPRRTELIGTFIPPSNAKILTNESFYSGSDMKTTRCISLDF